MFKQLDFLHVPQRRVAADHVEGEQPILVYRVGRLREALKDLEARGWEREGTYDIPQGPLPLVPNAGRTPDQLRGVAGHGRLAIDGSVI